MEQRSQILRLAEKCLGMQTDTRPEIRWLTEKYERFRQKQGGISKAEADQRLYQRIRKTDGARNYGSLKVRYWRTGKHVPINREQCQGFGAALELSEEEMLFLLQQYYDRRDQICEELPGENNRRYWEQRGRMEKLQREYLMKVRPELFFRSNVTWESQKQNFRHLYYMDACRYTDCGNQWYPRDRSVSMSYHSELNRTLQLLGEIPRKTMIRHLVILCVPYLSQERLSEYLQFFGYLPLTRDHTQTGGEYLDWLLIQILELYRDCCSGKEPEFCTLWFQKCCRLLDGYFAGQGEEGLRFMNFKALNR